MTHSDYIVTTYVRSLEMTPIMDLHYRILDAHKAALQRAIARRSKRDIAFQTAKVAEIEAFIAGLAK